jgi:nucleoside-diphosphate-sugar epimerase
MRDRRQRAWSRNGAVIVEGDLESVSDCRALLQGADEIYHLGGLGLRRLRENPGVNERGTASMLRAWREQGASARFVFVSSIKAGVETTTRNGRHLPQDPYALDKRSAEAMVFAEAEAGHFATIVRAPAIYGPRDTNMVPFFKLAQKGALPRLHGNLPGLSQMFVDDFARFLLEYEVKHPTDGPLILEPSHPEPTDWNGLVDVLAEWAGRAPRVTIRVDALKQWSNRLAAFLENRFAQVDIALLRISDMIDGGHCHDAPVYCEEPIALRDGVAATGQWYKSVGWV